MSVMQVQEMPVRDAPAFATLLPQGLVLDAEAGVILLTTPRGRWQAPTLALGCAWTLVPRNIEVLDESVCLDLARLHTSLLRSLPVGGALQGIMAIGPSTSAPAWEALREGQPNTGVVAAQRAAIRAGLPHREGAKVRRLRTVETFVSLRLPVPALGGRVALLLRTLLESPSRNASSLARRFQEALTDALAACALVASDLAATLQEAGHGVTRLDGRALGQALARSLAPWQPEAPTIQLDVPLSEQVVDTDVTLVPGGVQVGTETAQVLSLSRAPRQTYPGILSAPRAPEGTQPLALWHAWDGPLTLVVNIAAVDQGAAKSELQLKRFWANLHSASLENKALTGELDGLLTSMFVTGGQFVWGRVHVVLWGQPPALTHGLDAVRRAARQLELEFTHEPVLGSGLFLTTLLLGFDPAWPKETYLRRARRLLGRTFADLLPFYGAFRGTKTPSILFLNQRGETVGFDPFDSQTSPSMVVTGVMGAGKSYLWAYVAQQILPLGSSIVILDRLASYRELCAEWDGTYLQMGMKTPICFNPFYGPLDREHRSFLTECLTQMASTITERLTRDMVAVLSDALAYQAQTWDAGRGELTLGVFVHEVLRPGAFTEPEDTEGRELARRVALRLNLFYGRGPYAAFFDGSNQLQLDPRLTVVELSGLSEAEDLQSAVLFVLMHLLTQFFAAPERLHQKKYFGCDETVFLLKHPTSAAILEEIELTFRKLRTSAIWLAQFVEHLNSPAGRAIRKGSPAILTLEQSNGEVLEMAKTLNMSPVEASVMQRSRRQDGWSSGYLSLAQKTGGFIHIIPDRYTHLLVSQDPTIRQRRVAALETTDGEMRRAIALLMAEDLAHAE